MVWETIQVQRLAQEIVPDNTFFIGQVFNWTKSNSSVFRGTLKNKLLELEFSGNSLRYNLTPPGSDSEIRTFLNLSHSLPPLLNTWKKDRFFASVCNAMPGVRILKQPVFECLISFICSQNANVSKIAKNIQGLKQTYGERICFKHDQAWYAFPTVEELSAASEEKLGQLGLGYRAKYIVKTVQKIKDKGGELWLDSLEEKKTEEIREELMRLDGVGPKVADCVLLFAFNRFEVVPIDVHMWNIAKEHYGAKKYKSLTKVAYKDVQKKFRQVLGEYAGWAHSILFAASLRKEIQTEKKDKKNK
jgi:N-glycosylase/DNA lyase